MSKHVADDSRKAPNPVSFGEAFRYWLKLGFVSFGGPAGQISMMHHDLVEKHRWISEHRFLHALNYCMVLPGPEAIQLAIYIGWLMHGVLGGLIAGILFLLPSLALLISLSWVYLVFGDVPDHWTILGSAVVIASGLYLVHRERVAHRQSKVSG